MIDLASHSLLLRSNRYWGKTRRFVKRKAQCFWTANATADASVKKFRRAADFQRPIQGKWQFSKEDLPLYCGSFPGTPTDKCFSQR